MRNFDLSPLYRSTVGFDRLFSLLDQASGAESAVTYPPYNIERTGETAYRITLAVAGFSEADLAIEIKEHVLVIKGAREAKAGTEPQPEILYQGIAARAFERRFQLAEHVELVRKIPEAQKPRRIEIGGAKVVEASRQAA